MTDQFTPRTVVVVALASLVAGFVTVFGGGMLTMRSHARPEFSTESSGSRATNAPTAPLEEPPQTEPTGSDDAGPEPSSDDDAGSAEPVQAAGITLTPMGVSRCFDGMAPLAIPGERCGTLPALDQHFASRAAQIAACANGAHGRLAFVMDFRFSNQHVSAWGGPASTISNAGIVSLCVRRATAPLPLATIAHPHDRYIATVVIEWQ